MCSTVAGVNSLAIDTKSKSLSAEEETIVHLFSHLRTCGYFEPTQSRKCSDVGDVIGNVKNRCRS